jgi:uncharacterized protein (TIGR03086 family)
MSLAMFRNVANDGFCGPEVVAQDFLSEGDAAKTFADTGGDCVAAWSEPGRIDGMAKLPYGEMPAAFALQIGAMDTVVHAWDLARATGQDIAWNEGLAQETLAFCEATFSAPEARTPHFAPQVETSADADTMTRLAGFLGRSA